ncbi:hypothetical protein A0U91_16140 (plasmid) [Acetobacter persici]|uniref:Uncharacterized protein n=1 Tax=Acetobacter persici TaxID=1076596 RepID=A0A1U9LJB5_9PROT|nr:hypothetical protein A0U91_16140 [Acetobacter persici]
MNCRKTAHEIVQFPLVLLILFFVEFNLFGLLPYWLRICLQPLSVVLLVAALILVIAYFGTDDTD